MAGQAEVVGEPEGRQGKHTEAPPVLSRGEVEEIHGLCIGNTVALSEEYLDGKMSPSEYADRRAKLVGKPGLVGSILAPLFGLAERG